MRTLCATPNLHSSITQWSNISMTFVNSRHRSALLLVTIEHWTRKLSLTHKLLLVCWTTLRQFPQVDCKPIHWIAVPETSALNRPLPLQQRYSSIGLAEGCSEELTATGCAIFCNSSIGLLACTWSVTACCWTESLSVTSSAEYPLGSGLSVTASATVSTEVSATASLPVWIDALDFLYCCNQTGWRGLYKDVVCFCVLSSW